MNQVVYIGCRCNALLLSPLLVAGINGKELGTVLKGSEGTGIGSSRESEQKAFTIGHQVKDWSFASGGNQRPKVQVAIVVNPVDGDFGWADKVQLLAGFYLSNAVEQL